MDIAHALEDLSYSLKKAKDEGQKIAFVPTMGALHAGHMALVSEAKKYAEYVAVSIFVNPTQFGPNEDLAVYPRTWDADLQKLQEAGIDCLWAPNDAVMYPKGRATDTQAGSLGDILEGAFRPGFFDGVTTVVRRLFDQVKPDSAFFGEKDYQQLCVIRNMVKDYNLPIEIIGIPTQRDENGLALSSRNAYLSKEEYEVACHLNTILYSMADKIQAGEAVENVESWGVKALIESGFTKVDYCTIRHAKTLLDPNKGEDMRVLAAAFLGKTRLIDNVGV